MMENDVAPPAYDDERTLPPRWAESRRYVPRTFVQPVLQFMRNEAAGGVVMLLAAVVALVWANSAFGDSYFRLFEARIDIGFGGYHFHHLSELTVQEWINDAMMVIFFFVVGLEIKRELVVGELRDPRAAAMPVLGALGGMLVPALIYTFFNAGGPASHGWGIPMATDIAFAVGVVSMIGRRVPLGAKLFLLALAIVDDLGAILVIAIFYTDELALGWLVAGIVGLAVVYGMRRAGIRSTLAYVAVGVFVWLSILESGVHATVAGVAMAFLTPVSTLYSPGKFATRANHLVERVDEYLPASDDLRDVAPHTIERVDALLGDLKHLAHETVSPLDRIEHVLSPWSSFVIVPIFALANAGVRIAFSDLGALITEPVTLGVALGLFVGKTVGVSLAAFLAVKFGLGRLPNRTTWSHMIGMGLLAGIGFTVALFVSALSFGDGSAGIDEAKVGIFLASIVAGLAGFAWLRFVAPSPDELDADHDGVLDSRQHHHQQPAIS
jgi:NhaA family Na+:H+ antiporter